MVRHYAVLLHCNFGEDVPEQSRRDFLRSLIPHEAFLLSKQTDIGYVKDPKYHYWLDLKEEGPIQAKPMRFRPEEKAWLDAHLDELTAKGVINPILPHETLRCVMPLLLVPG